MIKIHYSICPEHEKYEPVSQLSFDGVLESKSSVNSLDVFCLKFNHCRSVYPIKLIKTCDKFRYDEQDELRKVLSDINSNNVILDCCIFDNPKRSLMTCKKAHSAKHPCEYCEHPAVTYVVKNKNVTVAIDKKYELREKSIQKEIQNLKSKNDPAFNETIIYLQDSLVKLIKEKEAEMQKNGRKQLRWPASTMNGELRIIGKIKDIVTEIKKNPDILKKDPDFCKGVKGESLLLNQPNYDMIEDTPCEYMHIVCLGVIKRLVELTFRVGENRERLTKRKLSCPKLFNEKIKHIQVTREFSRRCRNLDFSVLKASEYRNILIFFFPVVLECIEPEFEDDQEIWLHLVFMVRACLIPNNEYRKVKETDVLSACTKFYILFEKLFGEVNCSYSIHNVASHLIKIRGNRPLTHRSAFKFESFYSEMRHLFHAGSVSPLKQILQNCYAKRLLEHHYCDKTLYFCPEKKKKGGKRVHPGKENNSLIYTYDDGNDKLSMYKIIEVIDENNFKCHVQGKFLLKLSLTPEYDWSHVGVYRVGPVSEEVHYIKRHDICGKVLKVNNYLITCPNNVLDDQ